MRFSRSFSYGIPAMLAIGANFGGTSPVARALDTRMPACKDTVEDHTVKLNRKQIQANALELLESASGGIRWGELLKLIHAADPKTPQNSIHGALQVLFASSEDIVKVARGTYQLQKYQDDEASTAIAQDEAIANEPVIVETNSHTKVLLLESDFYDSFAEWLADVAEEVNVAVALGGSVLKGKWGTPDVIGVLGSGPIDVSGAI